MHAGQRATCRHRGAVTHGGPTSGGAGAASEAAWRGAHALRKEAAEIRRILEAEIVGNLRVAGVNYFFRRIASPDWLPIGGRCLTVIVTGGNNLGGSDGEETQWIGTSGTDCGGSRSIGSESCRC